MAVKAKDQHIAEAGTRILALFFVALMFFAYSVEVFHHHDQSEWDNENSDTVTSVTKYSAPCMLCELIVTNLNTGFLTPQMDYDLNPPLSAIVSTEDAYNLHFYKITLPTSKNKGPPPSIIA